MRGLFLKLITLFLCSWLLAPLLQAQEYYHPNWQNLDLQHDTVFGISTERAYRELLLHKKATTVIIAVLDIGIDTSHEDLKGIIWNNPRELPGNGIDDDHNGYVDDMHGWNFIGGTKDSVPPDNGELVRLIRKERSRYDTLTAGMLSDSERPAFLYYRAVLALYNKRVERAKFNLDDNVRYLRSIDSMTQSMGKDTPSITDFQRYRAPNKTQEEDRVWTVNHLMQRPGFGRLRSEVVASISMLSSDLQYHLNLDYDPRAAVVGDDYSNDHERVYGNADVMGPNPFHGTFIAGIIGAARGNGKGIDGIANQVQIMSIRIGYDGDERDKDVANAIRYAAENGAKVISMTFGKDHSSDKKIVDEAVKYAMSRDVLIVHSAGNDGKNEDDPDFGFFPTKYYGDGGQADAWITVGASDWLDDSSLIAPWSNYGKRTVDIFAPGVQIYSCTPGSKYDYAGGTSFAGPVVAGVAALIREYYPKLSAAQVREIILRSVVKPTHPVTVTDGKISRSVHLSDICTSGGVVNAYNALKLAATY